jgi:alpha-beta hydrolase superfamily lysophospholipase
MRGAGLLLVAGSLAVAAVPSWFPRGFRRAAPSDPPALSEYLRAEDLAIADSVHRMGTVRVGDLELACHAWLPARSRGTVFLVHGYYNQCGIWSSHIRRFLSEGWSVATFDLPGHGLSDGRRFDIDSIAVYGWAVRSLEDSLQGRAPLPWSLVGHSLGGTVVLERARQPAYPYANTVLLAPMLRYSGWGWIGWALPPVSLFRDYVPRGKKLNSTRDTAFLSKVENDPLEGWTTSTHWLKAVRTWNAELDSKPLAESRWFVLQGDSDATVDWHEGLGWLRRNLPGGRIRMFPGARHHLQDEAGLPGILARAALDSAVGGGLP